MLFGFEKYLARAENVPGGMEGGGYTELKEMGNAERNFVNQALSRDACIEEKSGRVCAKNLRMACDVVRVSMGNERTCDAGLGVE